MGIVELLFVAVGLSMDAFAVSICKGLALEKINFKKCAVCGLWFGVFQALMPFIGYLLGAGFQKYIEAFSSWIAFVLLALIGGNMIREAVSNDDEKTDGGLGFKTMFLLAIATSIDALAVGISFACVPVSLFGGISELLNTVIAVIIIGITTFAISCAGVKIGNVFGEKYKAKAEIAGGVILILIGLKIIIEHLFF